MTFPEIEFATEDHHLDGAHMGDVAMRIQVEYNESRLIGQDFLSNRCCQRFELGILVYEDRLLS
jgi:hypothetical protein